MKVPQPPPPRPIASPTSGIDDTTLPYASQPVVSRLSGSASGTCFAVPHSPWSPPLAPPAPLRVAPLCSPASQLLWRSPTSRVRASSATAPRLPDADRHTRHQHTTSAARHEISQLPVRSLCT